MPPSPKPNMAEYVSASTAVFVVVKRNEAAAMTSATAAMTKRTGTFSTTTPHTTLPTPRKIALKLMPKPAMTAPKP